MSIPQTEDQNFSRLLGTLVDTHSQLQQQAARSVDLALVARNWLFGWYIVEFEQGAATRSEQYGKQLISRLSDGLSLRGLRGVSSTNLKQCRNFYLAYPKIGQTLSDQSSLPPQISTLTQSFSLGWSHYVALLSISDTAARQFYEIEATQSSWGVRELKRQIQSCLFERLALSRDKQAMKLLSEQGQLIAKPSDIIKNPYVLEFLDLPEHPVYSEHQLETAIIDKLEKFLLELGKGFLFEARQKRFTAVWCTHRRSSDAC